MAKESDIARLISELTRLTVQGAITWRPTTPPSELSRWTDDVIANYFETEFKDQTIGLAARRYRDYDPQHDDYTWGQRIVLLFVNRAKHSVIWDYSERSSALLNLFNTVREKVADVDGILKKLLSDDSDKK